MRRQPITGSANGRGSYLFSLGLFILIIIVLVLIGIPGVRHVRHEVETQACVENLVRLATAKEHYVLAHDLKPGAPVTIEQLLQSKDLAATEFCPLHGAYSANAVGTLPTCSVKGHELPVKPKPGK